MSLRYCLPYGLLVIHFLVIQEIPARCVDSRAAVVLSRVRVTCTQTQDDTCTQTQEREFFIVNLLVQIHFIIWMILVVRPCAMGIKIPFSM